MLEQDSITGKEFRSLLKYKLTDFSLDSIWKKGMAHYRIPHYDGYQMHLLGF